MKEIAFILAFFLISVVSDPLRQLCLDRQTELTRANRIIYNAFEGVELARLKLVDHLELSLLVPPISSDQDVFGYLQISRKKAGALFTLNHYATFNRLHKYEKDIKAFFETLKKHRNKAHFNHRIFHQHRGLLDNLKQMMEISHNAVMDLLAGEGRELIFTSLSCLVSLRLSNYQLVIDTQDLDVDNVLRKDVFYDNILGIFSVLSKKLGLYDSFFGSQCIVSGFENKLLDLIFRGEAVESANKLFIDTQACIDKTTKLIAFYNRDIKLQEKYLTFELMKNRMI